MPFKRTIFVIFALLVFRSVAEDIIEEFQAGESLVQMSDDVLLLAISGCIVLLFGIDHFAQKRSLTDLRTQLDKAKGRLAQVDERSPQLASEYRTVMQKQFDAWKLTASEQEVVLGLLKGLSFRELAELRETREKTVRQQATSVYRKAGVTGRHELAAWFFEDMLEESVNSRL